MNSAVKVGEIFQKAGETFHKLADMTVMLDPVAKELLETTKVILKINFNFPDYYSENLEILICRFVKKC